MRISAVFLTLLLVAGCGYHFPGTTGQLPGNVERIYVPLFENRTSEPRLEQGLAGRINQVLVRSGRVVVVEQPENAEAVLKGVITGYGRRAVSYDKNDDISEYRSTMRIDVELVATGDGAVLWHKAISWSTDYSADDNKAVQENYEDDAIDELQMRLAEELYDQLLSDF